MMFMGPHIRLRDVVSCFKHMDAGELSCLSACVTDTIWIGDQDC